MTTSHAEMEEFLRYDKLSYNEQMNKIIQPILPKFDRIIKSFVLFNMIFAIIGFIEVTFLLFFFTFLTASSLLAFGFALIFLTFFGYFIFRIYFQATKPVKLQEIKNRFVGSCKALLNYQEGTPEHHMALANACSRLSEILAGRECLYYRPPKWLEITAQQIEFFSQWWHWQDVHKMRELLLLTSIEEHIQLVRCEPTSLEIHAALANAYVMLSTLYAAPLKRKGTGEWIRSDKDDQYMENKFRITSEKAIEEFKIISDYAPNDPWVHLQLAYSYHDLHMPLEEINAYETILRINPEDREVLFKLGSLYFQQGMNAKGLRIYEELKHYNYKKAETLIKLYGT